MEILNPNKVTYELVSIKNDICLLTDTRIDKTLVPKELYVFDIRHADSGDAETLEQFVVVNYYATLISKVNLLIKRDTGVFPGLNKILPYLNIKNKLNFLGETTTLSDYIKNGGK